MNTVIGTKALWRNGDLGLPVATPMSVRDAAYHIAHACPGGVGPLALRMRVNPNTLMHKVSVTNSTHHLTVDEAVVMQAMAGNFSILHAMAAELGHVAILQHAEPLERPMDGVSAMVGEFAALLGNITAAISDGSVTLNQMRECESRAMETIGAISAALCAVRSMVPGGPA